ncbi:MAG: Na+/H+ antiporter [Agriterribacter sp.]
MHQTLPFLLAIIVLIVLLILLAKKIKVAYPILLVLAGLLISSIPSVPKIKLDPDWIFFIFLPPLLFEAAWSISYKQMKKMWRVIGSFSFLVVIFTATSVAIFANYFIPGFSLALGFLLGGIVSPPDAVSAGAILKFVKVPRSTATLLEGESLFNDASSLIIFRFAMIAVGTGQFIWGDAIVNFSWMVAGGVGIGLLLAWLMMQGMKRLPTDAPSDITFTLIAPYILYWVAEQSHSSGVMAVVSGGLYLANHRMQFLNSQSRVRGSSFWESFVFILNGLVFFIIGFDFPEIVGALNNTGIPVSTGIYYGVLVTGFIILIRIISSFAAMFATLIFRRSIVSADFSWRRAWTLPIVLGWTGMRGVVSLAAALSIPAFINDNTPFPQRELILFISFMVIILTLFVQGLTLPIFLKRVNLYDMMPKRESEEQANLRLRKEIWQFSLTHVQQKHGDRINGNAHLAKTLVHWQQKLEAADDELLRHDHKEIYLQLLEAQRQFLVEKNKDETLDEELVRKQIYLIDLEEERVKAV